MDLSSREISSVVLKRIVRDDIGNFPLDHQMLNVFIELDGKATLGMVAQKVGLNMSTMREVVARLMEIGIIEMVEIEIHKLDKDFVDYLVAQLSLAIGPIAQVLIEDEVQDLGYALSEFPGYRVAELIDNLAREIRREEKRSAFIKNMANKIREKDYLRA